MRLRPCSMGFSNPERRNAVSDSEPSGSGSMIPRHQLPWAVRARFPRNRVLRKLSWIWSNAITIAIPSQIENRRHDVRRLLDRLKRS
jgi:hypothetical protein